MKKNVSNAIYRVLGTIYFFVFFIMFCTTTASAYIDPATTAMLTQIIAGVFITLGVVLGVYRRKVIMFFKNMSVNRAKKKIEKQADKDEHLKSESISEEDTGA